MEEGALDTANWFKKVKQAWDQNRTENNRNKTYIDWLDWSGKLTARTVDARSLVVYTASAKNTNATYVDRASIDLPFVVKCTTYYFVPSGPQEGHFLASFLNSDYANEIIEDFQNRGLFGARHVHTKILGVALPKFDPKNAIHIEIADLGKACH